MKPKSNEDLASLLSRLDTIKSDLPAAWTRVDRRVVLNLVLSLESEVSKHKSKTTPSGSVFADTTIFPSRESIVAFLDSELNIHLSPDWQRTRLEAEASRLSAGKSSEQIRMTASKLAKQNWVVRPRNVEAWQALFGKSEQQIRAELNDSRKFPQIEDLKRFATGLLTYDQMKSISKRETLVAKIVSEITRHSGVSRLGE